MSNQFKCLTCGENTTNDCIQSQTKFKKSIRDNKSKSSTIKYFPLKGLGPKYTIKKKKNFKHSAARKDLFKYVNVLNSYHDTTRKGDLFAYLFNIMKHRASIKSLNKNDTEVPQQYVLQLLKNIIPSTFLTTVSNNRKLLKIIKLNITGSHNEQIYEEVISNGFNLNCIQWLPENSNPELKHQLLCKGIKIVLLHIIFPLIYKLFKFIPTYSYELICFSKNAYNRAINKMVKYLKNTGIITSVASFDHYRKAAYLSFKPKHEVIDHIDLNSFRIIALFPKRNDMDQEKRKQINKLVHLTARETSFVKTIEFFEHWSSFVNRNRHKRLFIVKLDVTDCFGNIPTNELVSLVSDSKLSFFTKNILVKAIQEQFIMFGKKGRQPIVWKWNHGVLQGMRFSNALCELYLSSLESEEFKDFNRADCFIYRKVDDYFFASTKRKDVFRFVEIAKRKLKINDAKTQSNVMANRTTSIHFCGMEINTQNFKIKCAFQTSVEFYKRFRFWNPAKPIPRHAMLDRATYFNYNNFYFQTAVMDIQFNGITHVLQNFFESMIFVAFKLDAAIMSATYRYVRHCHVEKLLTVAMNTTKFCIKQVLVINLSKVKCIPLLYQKLQGVGLRAFELVFKRRQNKAYCGIVKKIEEYLKDECEKHAFFKLFLWNYRFIPVGLRGIKMGRTCKVCKVKQNKA